MSLDAVLWNEHTDLVHHVMPDVEATYPDLWLWYEIKGNPERFTLAGATVVSFLDFSWVGCPRGRDIGEYLVHLGVVTIPHPG